MALRHRRITRFGTIAAPLLLALAGSVIPIGADAAIYLKLDEIEGDTALPGRIGWSRVLTVDWGISAGGGSSLEFFDLAWTQQQDVSFPDVFERMANQRVVDFADVDFTVNIGGVDKVYFNMHFDEVLLTELTLVGSSGGNPECKVSGKFEYGKIAVEYTLYDEVGDPVTIRSAEYDLRSQVGAPAQVAQLFGEGIIGPTVVPIPGAVWLLGSALVVLAGGQLGRNRMRL